MATITLKAPERTQRAQRAASSVAVGLGLALVPKCPLCVALYLTSLGLSASTAAVAAPVLSPLVILLCVAALGGLLLGWGRRARRAPLCCRRRT